MKLVLPRGVTVVFWLVLVVTEYLQKAGAHVLFNTNTARITENGIFQKTKLSNTARKRTPCWLSQHSASFAGIKFAFACEGNFYEPALLNCVRLQSYRCATAGVLLKDLYGFEKTSQFLATETLTGKIGLKKDYLYPEIMRQRVGPFASCWYFLKNYFTRITLIYSETVKKSSTKFSN